MTHPPATGHLRGFNRGGLPAELAILAAALAVVMIVIAGGIRGRVSPADQGGQLEAAGTIENVRGLMRRAISETMQRFYAEPNGARLLTFAGERDGMTFVAPAPVGSGQYGLSAFSLDLVPAVAGGGRQALALSQIIYRPDIARGAVEAAPHRILIDNIESMSVKYYGSQEQGEPAQWRNGWNSSRYLPQLIAIDVSFGPGDARSWQTLIVDLKLTVQPG